LPKSRATAAVTVAAAAVLVVFSVTGKEKRRKSLSFWLKNSLSHFSLLLSLSAKLASLKEVFT